MAAARALAHSFHANNIKLVYGGGTVGLMGELARTLVSLSGPSSVHGIIPSALIGFEKETASFPETSHLSQPIDESLYGQTTVVPDMHTRKSLMASYVLKGGPGSGFVALSGGYGTLEELMEMVTWNQLGIHDKGIVVFNVDGYYDGVLDWVDRAVKAGFISKGNGGIIVEARDADATIKALKEYKTSAGRFKLDWTEK